MSSQLSLTFTALALAVAVSARAAEPAVVTLAQAQALGVESAVAQPAAPPLIEGLPAQVTVPNNQVFVVSAPVAALVEQIAVAPGDAVRKGQSLARLQSPDLIDAQRGLLQAAAQHRLAASNLERDRQLHAEGIIPESRLVATRSRYVEAQAALEERRQALGLAGMPDDAITRLQRGERLAPAVAVTAPIDGTVLEQFVTAGQRVEAAVPLFRVARLEPLALEIRAPAARIHGVAEGAEVQATNGETRARIVSIGRSVDVQNQSVLLRALVTTGSAKLRVGEFVQVSIQAGGSSRASWTVPNAAVARAGGNAYVFVETPRGFQAERVTLLAEGAEVSQIEGQLAEGARIAVRGAAALKAALLGQGAE